MNATAKRLHGCPQFVGSTARTHYNDQGGVARRRLTLSGPGLECTAAIYWENRKARRAAHAFGSARLY